MCGYLHKQESTQRNRTQRNFPKTEFPKRTYLPPLQRTLGCARSLGMDWGDGVPVDVISFDGSLALGC
eukprot:2640462-Amphidinium_carterae.1